MKNLRKQKSNLVLAIIFVLLLSLFIILRYTGFGIAADDKKSLQPSTVGTSPEEQTEASKEKQILEVNEWVAHEDDPGVHDVRHPDQVPPLRDLLPGDQVTDDGIYITVTDLHTIPSLFCTAKGTHLPSWNNTVVKSNGYETDVTDQGKKTGYLTEADVKLATCFRNDSRLRTGWITSGTHTNALSATSSETLAKFGDPQILDCTPVEAYIMAEYDKSISGVARTFKFTTEEYKGDPPARGDNGNPRTAFVKQVNSIAQFCYNKKYSYGNMGDVPLPPKEDDNTDPDPDKKINNRDLVKWAMYGLGYKNVSAGNLESTLKANKWEEVSDVKLDTLTAGDIIFLKNESDSDGVLVFSSKNSVYDLSSDAKILTGQPVKRELKEEDIGKVLRFNKDAKVDVTDTLATRYDVDNLTINGVKIFMVGNPGEEKYVAQNTDGKWYYVIINDDPEWSPNSEPQNAWWEKSTKSIENGSAGFTHTDLADEAQAFENYVLAVNGATSVDQLTHNEDGTYHIDYKTDFEPKDSTQIKVRFDAEENTYIVGPFKADYTRAVTDAGERPTVSFAGISRVLLVGIDAQGRELTNEDGTNRLKLNENYRFVYDDDAAHEALKPEEDKNALDQTDYYKFNYPYPGEWFYLSIDYIDDLYMLQNFKMDFQYMTSGGQYEYFKGTYLIINWEPMYDIVETRVVEGGSGGYIQNEETTVAYQEEDTSSRAGRLDDVSSRPAISLADIKGTYVNIVDFTKVVVKEDFTNWWGSGPYTITRGNTYCDDDFLYMEISIDPGNYSIDDITVTGGTYSGGTNGTIKVTKDRTKVYGEVDISVSVKGWWGILYGWTKVWGTYGYYNSFLREDGTAKVNNVNNGDIKIEDNVIYKKGLVIQDMYTLDFDAYDEAKGGDKTIEKTYFSYDQFTTNSGLSCTSANEGKYKLHATGDGGNAPYVQVTADDGTITEKIKFDPVYVHRMCDDDKANTKDVTAGSGDIQIWNAFIVTKMTSHTSAAGSLPDAVNFYISGGKVAYYRTGVDKDADGVETAVFTNQCGDTYTVNASYTGRVSGGDDDGGDTGGGDEGSTPGEGSGESQYQDYLVADSADPDHRAQEQSNAVGDHKVVDVDAEDGLGDTPSGQPVEIEFYMTTLPLYTSISGVVWVDHDSDKTGEAGAGNLGIADGYDAKTKKWSDNANRENKNRDYPVEANSVEIIVWKVKYQTTASGSDSLEYKEVERTKAIGWTLTSDGKPDKEINFIEDDGRLFVDDNGNYTIPAIQVPSAEGKEKGIIYSYDVEFIYDGQTYETTEYMKPLAKAGEWDDDTVESKLAAFKKTEAETGEPENHADYTDFANSSYVVENAKERYTFDNYFKEVFGEKDETDYKASEGDKSEMTAEGTKGYATGGRAGSYYNGQIEDVYIENPEDDTGSLEYKTTKRETIEVAENTTDSGEVTTRTEANDQMSISTIQTRDENNFIKDQYRFAARTSEAKLLLPYETKYHIDADDPYGSNPAAYNNLQYATQKYKPIDEYFDQINMGLLERFTTDISLVKDLYTAKTIVNNMEITLTYNGYRELTEANLHGRFTLLPENRTYKIDLYNADYFYRSSIYETIQDTITKQIVTAVKDGTELRMFLTYRIAITNGSDFTNVSINEFKDYYDSSFTLVTEDISAQVRQAYLEHKDAEGHEEYDTTPDNELVEKVVATKPHYRKLSSNITTEQTAELYKHDWVEDSKAGAINTKTGTGIGEVTFTKLDGSEINLENQSDMASNGFKASQSVSLKALTATDDGVNTLNPEMSLAPGEVFEIFVTYEVDRERFYEIYENDNDNPTEQLLGSKNNIAEITRYSTEYADVEQYDQGQTHENKQRHSTVSYATGQVSGRIDQDSAPDNANIAKTTTIENTQDVTSVDETLSGTTADQKVLQYYDDDTCSSPVVKINVRKAQESRSLDGAVWDDGKELTETSDATEAEKFADGLYDKDKEHGIQNVKTTLVEKIRVTADQYNQAVGDSGAASELGLELLDYEFEFIWPDNAFTYGAQEGATDTSNSHAVTDADGNYKFENFATGNYVVRFEYGNIEYELNEDGSYKLDGNGNKIEKFDTLNYNGQDYKNAYYQSEITSEKTGTAEEPVWSKKTKTGVQNPQESDATYVPGTEDENGDYTLNNEWHNLKVEKANNDAGKRYSDARDYEPRRIQVMAYSRIISNENAEVLAANINELEEDKLPEYYEGLLRENREELAQNTKMVANTAKLSIELEDQTYVDYANIKQEEGLDGQEEAKKYEITNIDFGLVLRPETKINLQSEINKIILTKNGGEEIILCVYMDNDGNIVKGYPDLHKLKNELTDEEIQELEDSITRHLEETKGVRRITEVSKGDLVPGSQGFKYIAIEQSYLQGVDVTLTYRITAYNNSDLDYIGNRMESMKEVQQLYKLATNFESGGDYAELDFLTSPFNTGKHIVYGKYVGLNYYVGEIAEGTKDADGNDVFRKVKDEQGKAYLNDGLYYGEAGVNPITGVNSYERDIYGADVLVSTTIDQVVDYIDNGVKMRDSSGVLNYGWEAATDNEIENKLSLVSFSAINDEDVPSKDKEHLLDYKGTQYVTNVKNNLAISHNELMTSTPETITYATVTVTNEDIINTQKLNDEVVKSYIEGLPEDVEVPELHSVQNLVPSTSTARVNLYTTITNNVRTNDIDTLNLILTNQLLPSRAFNHAETVEEVTKLDGVRYQTTSTVPRYSSYVYITTTTVATPTSMADMTYENLSEIMLYSNTAGRRDMRTIPGNANMIAKEVIANKAGYNRYVDTSSENAEGKKNFETAAEFLKYTADRNISEKDLSAATFGELKDNGGLKVSSTLGKKATGEGGFEIIQLERDQYAARDTVTFSEPTGLSVQRATMNKIVRIILIALTIAALVVIGVTVGLVVKKTKYDDKNIVGTDKN